MKLVLVLSAVALMAACLLPQSALGDGCTTFTLENRMVRGLAYEPGALWVIHSAQDVSDVVRISKLDPTNGNILQTSPDLDYNGRGICVALGSLWITDALADKVRELDPSDFHEKSEFSTPGSEPCGLTFDGTHLWLSDPWAHSVYELSTTGEVLGGFGIPDVYRDGLAWGNGGLWTNVGEFELGHYTPDGTPDDSYLVDCPPRDHRLFGLAFDGIDMYVSNLSGSSIFVIWPSAVPARPATWGQVKALYR